MLKYGIHQAGVVGVDALSGTSASLQGIRQQLIGSTVNRLPTQSRCSAGPIPDRIGDRPHGQGAASGPQGVDQVGVGIAAGSAIVPARQYGKRLGAIRVVDVPEVVPANGAAGIHLGFVQDANLGVLKLAAEVELVHADVDGLCVEAQLWVVHPVVARRTAIDGCVQCPGVPCTAWVVCLRNTQQAPGAAGRIPARRQHHDPPFGVVVKRHLRHFLLV